LWKLDLDGEYFRIFDSNKLIAGYFDPDYGNIFPKENSDEIISKMLKNHDKIIGGLLMIPLVKFGLFGVDLDIDIDMLDSQIIRVEEHLKKWKDFISKTNNNIHSIRISHTDQDMLTITFPIKFSEPTQLDKTKILKKITPTLDLLQNLNLL
jgi:hypothetical protein